MGRPTPRLLSSAVPVKSAQDSSPNPQSNMSIKAANLKSSILNSGKKIGILVAEDSATDRVLSRGTKVTATLINDGEKQAARLAGTAKSGLDKVRATIHAATAPRRRKQ